MPDPLRRQLRQPRVTTLDGYRLLDGYAAAAADIATRPWRLAAATLRRAVQRLEQGAVGPWAAEPLLAGLAEDAANLLFGLATAIPAGLTTLTSHVSDPPPGALSRYRGDIDGAQPQERGTLVQLGPSGTPFLAPARVLDASQGWAAWFVPRGQVLALLRDGLASGRVDAAALAALEPFDCRHERCCVVLLGVDYRVSDFGRYREIALAVCMTPSGPAAAPGTLFARLLVSDAFSLEPARRIWGLHKDWAPSLQVQYRGDAVQFCSGTATPADFRLTLPRFGSGRSDALPQIIYSVRAPDPAAAASGPARSVFVRSGTGEGMQIGGPVTLRLGQPASCFCRDPQVACLCAELRGLGLDATLPAANGWSERMAGQLQAPGPLALQPLGNQ